MNDVVFVNGALKVDYSADCACLKGEEMHLTPIEYKLLRPLSQNVGKVLTHTFITQKNMGQQPGKRCCFSACVYGNTQKKLESEPDSPQYIQIHIGVGYRMLRVE